MKREMKFDLPEPFAPIRMLSGRSLRSISRMDLKPFSTVRLRLLTRELPSPAALPP